MKCGCVIVSCLALAAVLQGCGSGVNASGSMAQTIGKDPNCSSLRDRLFSELYRQVEETGSLPAAVDVASEMDRVTNAVHTRTELVGLYGQVSGAVRGMDRATALQALAEMEIGDRTTTEKSARQDEVERRLASVRTVAVEEAGDCQEPPTQNPPTQNPPSTDPSLIPLFEVWRQTEPASLYGAYKAISVAYQSCNVMDQKLITSSTPAVSGITVVGTHPDGVGQQRVVSNASSLMNSNPYYANRVSPGAGCFSSANTPIIYDYGGKPYTANGILDFTKDAGTGTAALGVDCSGFVTSAVLSGGLRLRSGSTSKAAQVNGVSAAMLADPANNGLSCFKPLVSTSTATIFPGDIIAKTGHVVMVDLVGADPFGLARAKTAADCSKLTSSGFDFSVIQSSSVKGGIGMDRYRAADYLAGSSAMKAGLEAYAKSICTARFGGASVTLANTSQAVIIRHTGTAACVDQQVQLAGEGCMKSCAPNTLLAGGI